MVGPPAADALADRLGGDRTRLVLTAVLTLFLLRVALALSVIPIWQFPDEIRHVAFMRLLAEQPPAVLLDFSINVDELVFEPLGTEVEREIIASMAEHDWWRHIGRPTPHPLPSQFYYIESVGFPGIGGPSSYYRVTALLVRSLGIENLELQVHFQRALSAFCSVLTLMLAMAALGPVLGRHGALAAVAAMALHPQYLLVSSSSGPDALAMLCGTTTWCGVAAFFVGGRSGPALTAAWAGAVVGLLAKRVAFTLFITSALVTLTAAGRALVSREWTKKQAGRLVTAAVLAGGGLAGGLYLLNAEVERILVYDLNDVRLAMQPLGREGGFWNLPDIDYLIDFSRFMFTSSWLVAGWVRYPAPEPWLAVVGALTAVAAVGIPVAIWKGTGVERRQMVGAVMCVATQLVAVFGVFFVNRVSAQGKHLFPMFVPMVLLFWLGSLAWWPRRHWPVVSAGLVLLVGILDILGWLTVIMPAYL